jgi:diguanylate cyclase (GGDEF)-like protein
VSISVALSLAATAAVFGLDLSAAVPVSKVVSFGLIMAAAVPAIICPLMRYPTIMAVRERDRAHAELRRLAQTDQLTGLLNRRGFSAAAQSAIGAAKGERRVLSVLMLDADFFKDINDRFGHEFGDAALVHLAEIVRRKALGPGFVVGRRGGEEFIVLAPELNKADVVAFAEELRAACAAAPLAYGTNTAFITISIGIASYEGDAIPLAELIREADAALYRAKQTGRNRVVLAPSAGQLASAA